MANPMAITLDQYNTGIANFQAHYFLDHCSTSFTGQDTQMNWSDFAGAVNSFIATNNVTPADVALRFVFCYDAGNTNLYLKVQILTMTADTQIAGQYDLNDNPSVWYTITPNGLVSTTDHALMDSTFFNNFYYCDAASCTENSLQPLSANSGNYSQNIVFPWIAEVAKMYADNSSPTGSKIGFTLCSYQAAQGAPVAFPETLVIYLTDANGAKLIDNNTANGLQMKAADMGTLCPFVCDVYVMPL